MLEIINNYVSRNNWALFIKLHQEYSSNLEICNIAIHIPLNVESIMNNLIGYTKSIKINGKDMYMLADEENIDI